MKNPNLGSRLIAAAASLSAATALGHDPTGSERKRPSEAIQDNSFLVEEAYNQEAGVVQHIFNLSHGVNRLDGADDREWVLAFTQEWPVFSQAHQFSYSVPFNWLENGDGTNEDGVGDILLNYRFQALTESARTPAFAPRVSLLLPTGDLDRGTGNGEWGVQVNLPFSKVLSDRWTAHFNAGLTHFPKVRGERLTSPSLAGSVIYAASDRLNLMLEAVASWDAALADVRGTDREFSAVVSPGMRYAFNFSNDAQVVAGIAAPIGLTKAAPDFGVILYFSVEHFFARPRVASTSLAK